jgi:hypothetical protein
MSRFVLKKAAAINSPVSRMLPMGTTIADTSGNAVGADVVCPSLTGAPNPTLMSPLDAAGQAALAAAGFPGVAIVIAPGNPGYVAPNSCGADGISP